MAMATTRIALNGAAGAMGRRIICLLEEDPRCELAAALERPGHPELGRDAGELAGRGVLGVGLSADMQAEADVLVDFSAPAAAVARAIECAGKGMAVLVGTTGLTPDQRQAIERLADDVPVLIASNMSLGVNLMFRLAAEAAAALPEGYDIEIVEAHHHRKKDAPSGTALTLAERICEALGRDPHEALCYGRQGAVGARPEGQIGIHAVRGGDIVGEHTVILAGEGERLEITHTATSRDIFARGAIRAAAFLASREAGLYTMRDVVAG
jgi:4-hydroxy-tetrahydrodipicolinate reductase